MSRIEYTDAPGQNRKRRIRTAEGNFFCLIQPDRGPEVNRQNYNSGASWAYAILGPDLKRPGSQQTNTPTATKAGFTSGWYGQNRPSSTFYTNRYNQDTWILGHMINGAWGGSGASWQNLTPLTHTANMNHKTIESKMNEYLTQSYAYEKAHKGVALYWYGIEYLVECSTAPFADNQRNVSTNLYAYAPEFIRVTWRAIRIQKRTDLLPNQIPNFLANCNFNYVNNLPFTIPNFSGAIRNNGILPQGTPSAYGGGIINSGYNLGHARNNNFDGSCDVFQF